MKHTALSLACAALVVSAASCRSRGGEPAAPAATAAPAASVAPATTAPAAATPAAAAFEKLVGRWQRQDGGYVLDIRSISPEGKAEAGYYNPNPITVARAEAFRQEDALTLFVELRAPNYPGSTYRLVYDAAHDALVGSYFQALQGQTFDVAFVRR
jgi:uncharacterized protein (DUF2147 family)